MPYGSPDRWPAVRRRTRGSTTADRPTDDWSGYDDGSVPVPPRSPWDDVADRYGYDGYGPAP